MSTEQEERRSEHVWALRKNTIHCTRCSQPLDNLLDIYGTRGYWECPVEQAEFLAYMRSHEHE